MNSFDAFVIKGFTVHKPEYKVLGLVPIWRLLTHRLVSKPLIALSYKGCNPLRKKIKKIFQITSNPDSLLRKNFKELGLICSFMMILVFCIHECVSSPPCR